MANTKISLCLTSANINNNIDFDYIVSILGFDSEKVKIRLKTDFPEISQKLGLAHDGIYYTIRNKNVKAISEVLIKLQNSLGGKIEEIRKMCNNYNLNVTISIVIYEEKNNEHPEIFLTVENIIFLSQINAELGISFS